MFLNARDKRLLDVILATWVAIWILVGVFVWHEVRGLRPLATTVSIAGTSLDDTAAALRGYSAIPLVGSSLTRVANDATKTAVSARESARSSRSSIDRLAWILGVAVAACAILPIGLAYALLRLRR